MFFLFFSFWGHFKTFSAIWAILRFVLSSKTVLGSTHIVEQQSFSMLAAILAFEFYLILGLFLTFFGP